jgi:pantetheine-phosphate adenylyltransferase
MAVIGFYAGSFDPVTKGHADIIRRSLRLVDELVIGVGVHHGKEPLFPAADRIAMLEAETAPLARKAKRTIRVVTFANLVVEAAANAGASVIIRGLRDGTDLDYEMQMAGTNAAMAPEIETVYLGASPEVRHIAANLVRQIAAMGGDVSAFVSPAVAKRLDKRFAAKRG